MQINTLHDVGWNALLRQAVPSLPLPDGKGFVA